MKTRSSILRRIGFHAVALTLIAITMYPVLWMVFSTVKPSNQIVGNVNLLPEEFTLDNLTAALAGIGGVSFWTFFGNSLALAVLSVVGMILSTTVVAYAFARINFPGRNICFALMIATLLLPFHVVIIPQYVVFNNLDMINTWVPLLAPKFLATEAFFIFLMVQFMRNLPPDLDEAAKIDGAGHGRIFAAIMLPLMRPAIVTSSIFTFIGSWNDFLGPLLYLKKPDLYTLPVALRLFVDQTSAVNYGAQIAMALLALVPVLVFFIIFQRFLISGVATQGLKG
ncbi:carbohydrate ABC transporter permease [Arthrobacter sp. D2-10]